MNKLTSIILILVLSMTITGGCMNKNQLLSEAKYYEMQTAHLNSIRQQDSQPLFEITANDPNKPILFQNVASIKVYQPINNSGKVALLPQYKHVNYAAPWTNLLSKMITIAVPAYAAYKTIDSLSSNVGSTYTSSGSGDFQVGDSTISNNGADSFNEGSYNDSVREAYDGNVMDAYNDGMWDSNKDAYNDGMWDSNIDNSNNVSTPTVVTP